MKKIHFIWAHPRTQSLTAQIVTAMKKRAIENGLEISEFDLYRFGFSPVMQDEDEPRWDNLDYPYTQQVEDMFNSLNGIDTLCIVFPVWWYSFPAILKGYIDKVWTNGLAYGKGNRLPVNKIRWIALAGETKEDFEVKGNYERMTYMMNESLAAYCGVADSKVEFLFDTIGFSGQRDQQHYTGLFYRPKKL